MLGSTIHNYLLKEKLGAGGQGTIYLGEDIRLKRKVVVKILPPEMMAKTANRKRFEREAQLASQLDHPNICTIFDFGEQGDVAFIAMQYINGKTVRQLVDGKPLEMKSALSIVIQVTDALTYAHSQNVIHRDIKAGNVMVTPSGQAKILDFGLAKMLESEDSAATGATADRMDLTEVGIPYGTATYAAPEQARGDRVDHRADIFSTGVLLYELLTGIWAFQGKTVVEVRYEVLHGTPAPISSMRKDEVPPRLQAIMDKALAKDPADRYLKMSEMRDELRAVYQEISGTPATSSELIVPRHAEEKNLVSKFFGKIFGSSKPESESPATRAASTSQMSVSPENTQTINTSIADREKRSIAILPFKNLAQDRESQFYEFSLADAVITELAQLRSLIVRPSSAVTKYQGNEFNPLEAGRDLRVDAVLSAGFLRVGEKMRVTAQLLDTNSGEIIWSDRIDADAKDIFGLQDEISKRVLNGLHLELSMNEQERLGKRPTDNIEAYEEFLRGRDNFGRFIFRTLSLEDCQAAIDNFKRAVELDSNFALAYSGLGAAYANRVFKGLGDTTDYNRAETAFSKAIQRDPNVVEARVLMAFIYLSRGEKRKARAEINRLQEMFPNDASLHFVKANINRLDGEYEKALRSWDRLERLDPAARIIAIYNRARVYVYMGEMPRAVEEINKALKIEPNHPLIRIFAALISYYSGELERAEHIIEDTLRENTQLEGLKTVLAMVYAREGKFDKTREQLSEKVLEMARADHDMSYWTAASYAMMNERETALEWLNHSVRLGNENRPWFERDPNLASIRQMPEFINLMEQIRHS